MKEFLEALAAGMTGFPPLLAEILIAFLSSLAGATVATIVMAFTSTPAVSTQYLMGNFIVCWLTGGILGPSIGAPIIQSITKVPTFAAIFITSGGGWWFWTKYMAKKQEELLNKKEPPGPPGTPES